MWIQAFHNPEGKEEFGEKAFISLPKKAFCDFMQTSYKDRLYSNIKDYSNLPHPDECPVKAVNSNHTLGNSHKFIIISKFSFQNHFVIKDFPFNAGKYAALAKPGLWRIDLFASQDHEESHITKIGISIFTSVTVKE